MNIVTVISSVWNMSSLCDGRQKSMASGLLSLWHHSSLKCLQADNLNHLSSVSPSIFSKSLPVTFKRFVLNCISTTWFYDCVHIAQSCKHKPCPPKLWPRHPVFLCHATLTQVLFLLWSVNVSCKPIKSKSSQLLSSSWPSRSWLRNSLMKSVTDQLTQRLCGGPGIV